MPVAMAAVSAWRGLTARNIPQGNSVLFFSRSLLKLVLCNYRAHIQGEQGTNLTQTPSLSPMSVFICYLPYLMANPRPLSLRCHSNAWRAGRPDGVVSVNMDCCFNCLPMIQRNNTWIWPYFRCQFDRFSVGCPTIYMSSVCMTPLSLIGQFTNINPTCDPEQGLG